MDDVFIAFLMLWGGLYAGFEIGEKFGWDQYHKGKVRCETVFDKQVICERISP